MKLGNGIKVIRPFYIGKALYFPPKSVSPMRSVRVRRSKLFPSFSAAPSLSVRITSVPFCISAVARKISNLYAWILHLSISLLPYLLEFRSNGSFPSFHVSHYLIMGFGFHLLSLYLSHQSLSFSF